MTDSISRKFARLGTGVSATGTLTVNSATASAWATPRTLTLDGHLSGNVSIDGSHNVTLTASIVNNTVVLGTHTTGNYVSDITAGTGITVSGSGSETASVTIGLNASGVTANTYGSSTAVPVLAIDTYGRITSASTASVSSSISIAGDTGTDSVSLISDTLTFTGGTGITSAVTNNTVTLDIDNTVTTNSGSQTLTNKTISGADNTLSNIGNSSLTNSSITINGVATSLGGTRTLVTDDVAEDGSPINLWFTNARARGAVSVTDSGGDGSLTYDSGTGVFTYTGPSSSEVRAHFSAGTGVAISSGQVSIGQAVATNSNVTFNDVTVSGNLTVSGTTTTINTETINLADNTIVLNSNEAGTPSQDGGIEVERGVSTNATLLWDETNDYWKAGLSGSEVPLVTTTGTQTLTNKTINASQLVDASVSNAKLTNSTISGKALGTNLDTLTMNVSGTGLSGSSSYNGSSAATFTVTSNATSANTGSTIVARDASGNFSAGTITATLSGNVTGNVTGNASTATTLQTQRAINGVAFNGSADITVADSTKLPLTGGTLSGNLTVDTKIYAGGATVSSGYNGVYATNMVGAASGNKLIYLYNDGTTIKLDAYDYGVSGALSFNIGGNGGTPNLYTGSTVNNNVILHAGNYSSYPIMRYAGVFTGNFQDLTDSVGELRIDQVDNINGGGYSNQPPNVYTYGGVLSWRTANHSFQLYASHTGDLTFKTQWQNDNYSGWRRILHESNYTSFAPSLTGSGASGTWGINITGNAATATSATDSTKLPLSGGTVTGTTVFNTNVIIGQSSVSYASNDNTPVVGSTTSNILHINGSIQLTSNNDALVIGRGSASFFKDEEIGFGWGGGFYMVDSTYLRVRNGSSVQLYTDGIMRADGSMRSVIFYDQNDTSYYLNPNSTSVLNAVNYWGVQFWNGDGVYARGTNAYGYRFNNYADSINAFVIDNSGNTTSYASSRAPIFYDSNDTTYYIDPNTTSTSIYVRGEIRNPSIWINDGDNYNNYNENIRLFNAPNSVSVIGFSCSGTGGTPGTSILGYGSSYMERRLGDTWEDRLYSGYLEARGSYRAPIFYDSNNTGYYTDPASTSNYNAMVSYSYQGNGNVGGTGSAAWFPSGLYSASGATVWIYGHIYRNGYDTYGGGGSYHAVFYDNNNTNYYVDPAGTARLSYVVANGGIRIDGNEDLYLDYNYGCSIVGVYSSYRYQGVFSMGNSYKLARDGTTTGNLYGLAWSHPNTGGAAGNLNDHGLLVLVNGSWAASLTGSTRARDDMRAPIFYDNNDTGYYIDPNSTSNSALRIRGGTLHGPNTSWGAYLYVGTNGRPDSTAAVCATNGNLHLDCANGNLMYLNYYSGNAIIATDFRPTIIYDQDNTAYYVNPNSTTYLYNLILSGGAYFRPQNWIQFDSIYGIYWPNHYGAHLYANNGSSYTQLRTDGQKNGYDGIWLSYSAVAGMMYDGNGNGGVYREANGRWYFYYHLGNDCMGIGTSSTSSTYSLYLNKGVYAQSRVDATIFYDSNDTGYYCDPASTSYMYRTIFQGRMLFYGADQSSDGTNDAQLYFTPGGGLTIASITTSFETGFVGSSYPNNRQTGAQATYDKRFYVWQDLVQYYSDERLKDKTGTLNGALEAIKSWTPFKYVDNALANSFNFGSSKTQIGLSAQEVEAFYPELVELAPFDVENDFSDETNPRRISKSGENYLTLNYTRLVPVLVQAIKEQQAKIEELERRINNS